MLDRSSLVYGEMMGERNDHVREVERRYYANNLEKVRARHIVNYRKQKETDPEKLRALWKQSYAIKREKVEFHTKHEARWKAAYYVDIEGKKCESCGTLENIERHHPDYSRPLDVTALCRKCHSVAHRKYGVDTHKSSMSIETLG